MDPERAATPRTLPLAFAVATLLIHLARDPRVPLSEVWPRVKHHE